MVFLFPTGVTPFSFTVLTRYSADHVERLLRFCGANDSKPYCLLMPNYVAAKPYFLPALTGQVNGQGKGRSSPVFVCPRKRYNYWTPKGLREKGKVQGHVSSLGHRTSPFVSYWFVDLGPAVPKRELLGQKSALAGSTRLMCEDLLELPSALRP